MVEYILTFSFLGFAAIWDLIKPKRENLTVILQIYIVIILTILAGLRFEVGFDYYGYQQLFYKTPEIINLLGSNLSELGIHGEYGYILLNSIIKSLGLNVTVVFLTVSFFTVILTFISYRRISKYYFVAIYFYVARFYFLLNMGQIRQALAMSILMYSIKYLAERNLIKYIFVVLLAGSFHSVSYLMIPIYFISKINIKDKHFKYFILAAMVIGSTGWFGIVVNNFGSYLPESIVNYYYWNQYSYSLGLLDPVLLFRIGLLFILIKNRVTINNNTNYSKELVYLYFYGIIAFILLNEAALIATRIAVVFSIFEGILVASLIDVKNKLISFLLVFGVTTGLLIINFVRLSNTLTPYVSILFK